MHNSVIDKECIEFLTDPNKARRQKIIEKVTKNIIDRINGIAPLENAADQVVDHRKNISEIDDNDNNRHTDSIVYSVTDETGERVKRQFEYKGSVGLIEQCKK